MLNELLKISRPTQCFRVNITARWINSLTKNLTDILAIFENDKSRVSYNFFLFDAKARTF